VKDRNVSLVLVFSSVIFSINRHSFNLYEHKASVLQKPLLLVPVFLLLLLLDALFQLLF